MLDFLVEIFIRMFGMYLLIVPGSALRWWFSRRERPWKVFLEDDEVYNYRAGLLFWISIAALIAGSVYLMKF